MHIPSHIYMRSDNSRTVLPTIPIENLDNVTSLYSKKCPDLENIIAVFLRCNTIKCKSDAKIKHYVVMLFTPALISLVHEAMQKGINSEQSMNETLHNYFNSFIISSSSIYENWKLLILVYSVLSDFSYFSYSYTFYVHVYA